MEITIRAQGQDQLVVTDPSGGGFGSFDETGFTATEIVFTRAANPDAPSPTELITLLQSEDYEGDYLYVINELAGYSVVESYPVAFTGRIANGPQIEDALALEGSSIDFAGGEEDDIAYATLGSGGFFSGGGGNDVLSGALQDDNLSGGVGDDTVTGGGGNDWIAGNAGADVLLGGLGADTVQGDDGADDLAGDDGNDSLSGGADGDTLTGGTGDDILVGGTGDDDLFGGEGADLYILASGDGRDIIGDFEIGVDTIEINGVGFAGQGSLGVPPSGGPV